MDVNSELIDIIMENRQDLKALLGNRYQTAMSRLLYHRDTEMKEILVKILHHSQREAGQLMLGLLYFFYSNEWPVNYPNHAQIFLARCLTLWPFLEMRFEGIFDIQSLCVRLSVFGPEFWVTVEPLMRTLDLERRKRLTEIICCFFRHESNGLIPLSGWRLRFACWYLQGSCDRRGQAINLPPQCIQSSLKSNLEYLNRELGLLLLSQCDRDESRSHMFLYGFSLFPSHLLLKEEPYPSNSRAQYRLWLLIIEYLPALDHLLSTACVPIGLDKSMVSDHLSSIWYRLLLNRRNQLSLQLIRAVESNEADLVEPQRSHRRVNFLASLFFLFHLFVKDDLSVMFDDTRLQSILRMARLDIASLMNYWNGSSSFWKISADFGECIRSVYSEVSTNDLISDCFLEDPGDLLLLHNAFLISFTSNIKISKRTVPSWRLLKIICKILHIVERVLGASKRSSSICLLDLLKSIPEIPELIASSIIERLGQTIHSLNHTERDKTIRWLSELLINTSLLDLGNSFEILILDETFLRPLDPNSRFATVNFALSLGLRGDSHSDIITDQFRIFMRKGFRNIFKTLDEAQSTAPKRSARVDGSPGRGKSVCSALWAFDRVFKGDWLLWIHRSSEGTRIVIANPESIISCRLTDGALDKILARNCFNLCFFDGATVADTADVLQLRVWANRDANTRLCVVVSSDDQRSQVKFHRIIELDAWTENEFVEALTDNDFRKSVADLFNADEDLQLRIRAAGMDLNTLNQEDMLDTIQNIVREKFFYTGGSARFMFNFKIIDITAIIAEAVLNLPLLDGSISHSGKYSNTVFVNNQSVKVFSSEFAGNVFAEHASKQENIRQWFWANTLGGGVKGVVFENLISQFLKKGQSLLTDQSPPVWGNERAFEYSSDFLLGKSMKPVARKLFGLLPIAKSSQYFCCPLCDKKFTILDNLAAHIECHSSEIMAFSGDDNLEGNMQILLQDSLPLDCIDLTGKTNVWLIPRSRYTKVFDFIRYISDNEIWFIQVTIASEHKIVNYAYMREVASIITNNPQVKLVLAFLTPVNGTCIFLPGQKNQLKSFNIDWLECRLMNQQFSDLKL